jgi:hypothetical protein
MVLDFLQSKDWSLGGELAGEVSPKKEFWVFKNEFERWRETGSRFNSRRRGRADTLVEKSEGGFEDEASRFSDGVEEQFGTSVDEFEMSVVDSEGTFEESSSDRDTTNSQSKSNGPSGGDQSKESSKGNLYQINQKFLSLPRRTSCSLMGNPLMPDILMPPFGRASLNVGEKPVSQFKRPQVRGSIRSVTRPRSGSTAPLDQSYTGSNRTFWTRSSSKQRPMTELQYYLGWVNTKVNKKKEDLCQS